MGHACAYWGACAYVCCLKPAAGSSTGRREAGTHDCAHLGCATAAAGPRCSDSCALATAAARKNASRGSAASARPGKRSRSSCDHIPPRPGACRNPRLTHCLHQQQQQQREAPSGQRRRVGVRCGPRALESTHTKAPPTPRLRQQPRKSNLGTQMYRTVKCRHTPTHKNTHHVAREPTYQRTRSRVSQNSKMCARSLQGIVSSSAPT
jgi:hypothetical protein